MSIHSCAFLLVHFLYLRHAVLCLARECSPLSSQLNRGNPTRAVGARVISADAAGVLGVHALLQFGLAWHLRDCAGA